MDKVAVCRGDRGGVCYHVYDGYFYRNDSNNERAYRYLHCTTNSCPGRAVMPTAVEERTVNNFKMTTLHDHQPNMKTLYISNLKESILVRCESEFTPLKQIFDEEMAKAPKEIHNLLNYQNYKSTMSRVRRCIKVSLLSVLQDDIDNTVNSETENTEDLESAGEGCELDKFEAQPEITFNSKRKKTSKHKSIQKAYKALNKLSKSAVKKQKLCTDEEKTAEETLWFKEEEAPENTFDDENYVEDDYENLGEGYLLGEEVHFKGENADNYGEQYSEEVHDFDNVSEDENNYNTFNVGHEIEILTSEDILSERLKQSPISKKQPSIKVKQNLMTTNIKVKSSHSQTESAEEISENLQKYLKFNKIKPSNPNCQIDDVLSMFFKEIEATVRSFLPSVIIEAKGKISNLVNRLEMRNWQVKEKLQQQKQLEQQLQELQQKEQEVERQQQEVLQKQRQQLDKQLQWQQRAQEQQLQVWKQQQQQELQENQKHEHCQLQWHQPTPELQFKELQQKQQDILKQQQEILEKQRQHLNNQQLQWHQRAKEQQERLEKLQQQQEMKNNQNQQQENQELEWSQSTQEQDQQIQDHRQEIQQENQEHQQHSLSILQLENQQNIKSSPVVFECDPKVSVVYLSDTNLVSSTSKVEISKIARVQSVETSS